MSGSDAAFRRLMRLAIAEARKGVGITRPNPPVGAVVADGDGRVIGRGWHHGAGLPHAEVNAIADCGDADLSGATVAVTLEPCSTFGRTPPCTELLVSRGVRRVVIGTIDPNPKHSGRAIGILRDAGIEVVTGVMEKECADLIAPFASAMTRRRPRVTLKLAMTLDGRIADRDGVSKWITSPASRSFVQRLRKGADAILVGSGTALADNPSLLCRARGRIGRAWRVVADASGVLPPSLSLFTDKFADRTIVSTTDAGAKRLARTLPGGPSVWTVGLADDGRLDLARLLERLTAEREVMDLLCEGGGKLAGSLLKHGLVDRLVLFYAPAVFGDDLARPAFSGVDALLGDSRLQVASREIKTFGPDFAVILDIAQTSRQ